MLKLKLAKMMGPEKLKRLGDFQFLVQVNFLIRIKLKIWKFFNKFHLMKVQML